MVGSFYDPELDEGCAFELISFHGGIGGPQTRPFILYPDALEIPDEPILGAAAVHKLLARWRRQLAGSRITRIGRRTGPSPDYDRSVIRGRCTDASARQASKATSTSRSTRRAEPDLHRARLASNVGLMSWLLVGSQSCS